MNFLNLNSLNNSFLLQSEDKQIFSKKNFKVVSKKNQTNHNWKI